jgi:membrane protease YdiL (CAAX protease family)
MGGSAVLFGLWHILPVLGVPASNAALAQVVGTGEAARAAAVVVLLAGAAVGGVVFTELRLRSGSLLAPSALHWAFNGFGYFFAAGLAQGAG